VKYCIYILWKKVVLGLTGAAGDSAFDAEMLEGYTKT
jgi:hypothetical protein